MRVSQFYLPIGIAVAICVALLIVHSSETFQDCIERSQYKTAQETFPKKVPPVPITFVMVRGCWGDYADRNANAIIALFTVILAGSTIGLWFQTSKAAEAAKVAAEHIPRVERAYVKMSHNAPGIMFNRSGSDVRLKVKNYGATPAQITNALVNFIILAAGESLPNPPVYNIPERAPIRAFLVADDKVFFTENSAINIDDIRAMPNNSTLCVFGYVDYIDMFGAHHRGGYARVFLPDTGGNNLGFITQDGYNYDRPRIRGEGNDWT